MTLEPWHIFAALGALLPALIALYALGAVLFPAPAADTQKMIDDALQAERKRIKREVIPQCRALENGLYIVPLGAVMDAIDGLEGEE